MLFIALLNRARRAKFSWCFYQKSRKGNSLFTKRAKRVIRSFKLRRAKERFTLFCRKTSDLHKKLGSKFPTLSALYLPTPDSARWPGITLHSRTQSMSLYGHTACTVVVSWFNSHRRHVALPPTPPFLSRYVIYL